MEKRMEIRLERPVTYRWAGRFVAKDASWSHMERRLVDYELIVMEKGTLFIEDEWEQYEVKEGQYLLMEPTKLQRGWKNSKCQFYWMHFWSKEGEKCSQEQDGSGINVPKRGSLKNPDRLYVLLKQIMDCDLRYMDAGYNGFFATSILYELAAQVKMMEGAGKTTGPRRGEGEEAEKLHDPSVTIRERVDDYLYRHLSEGITVKTLAREFGYHEKYFSAMFKAKTGLGVKQYVDEQKTDRAKYLLLNTDAWVSEIAERLGYEDVQNFYHVFKKATNCTPSEYRNLYQKKKDYHV